MTEREDPTHQLNTVLASIERWLSENQGNTGGFRDPASEAEVAAFEEELGESLPADYRAFLLLHDGQSTPPGTEILPCGGRLAPLADVVAQWKFEVDAAEDDEEEACEDTDAIRYVRYHALRIPIGGNAWFDGDNFYLDLYPGPAGQRGQVLSMVSESSFELVGSSLLDFFQRLHRLLEAGKLVVRESDTGLRLDLAQKREPWDRWVSLLVESSGA